jgi:hypothetical protein
MSSAGVAGCDIGLRIRAGKVARSFFQDFAEPCLGRGRRHECCGTDPYHGVMPGGRASHSSRSRVRCTLRSILGARLRSWYGSLARL